MLTMAQATMAEKENFKILQGLLTMNIRRNANQGLDLNDLICNLIWIKNIRFLAIWQVLDD